MGDSTHDIKEIAPRRSFFGHLGGAAVLGLAGLFPKPLYAKTQAARADGPNWPAKLPGRHKQVVDAFEANSGFPLAFAHTFLAPNESATAVIVLRQGGFPIALGNEMCAKYKIGETFKIGAGAPFFAGALPASAYSAWPARTMSSACAADISRTK